MSDTNAAMPRRWRRIGANLALLAISLTLAAASAEVGVRVAAPQQLIQLRPDLWQPADTVGWLRRPNVSAHINTGERTVRLITDGDGFRIGTHGRTSGLPVLLLGDSFVEALQVEYEQSVAGRLEQTLTTATQLPIAIRNAAITGWAPGQYLARARTVLPTERYALVITFVYVGNDARPHRVDYTPPRQPAERHHFRLPRALSKTEFVQAALYPLNDALEVRSHLYILLRTQLETWRRAAGVSAQDFPREFLRSEATADRWSIAASLCEDIRNLAAAYGARTLFVLIPADFQVDEASFAQHVRGYGLDPRDVDLDQPTRRLYEELTARGLTVVDALPYFRQMHGAGEVLYGTVDKHMSPAGHRALADIVTPAAARLLTGQ